MHISGCGNGKYLASNPSVFNIGADKCIRLTKVAREKENEVRILKMDHAKLSTFANEHKLKRTETVRMEKE